MRNSRALIDESLVDSQDNPAFGVNLMVSNQETLFNCLLFEAVLYA